MNKVYVVTAYWSDWEWSRKDLVGIYSSKKKAEKAKEAYELDIQRIKNSDSPLTEEEEIIQTHNLPDERWEVWFNWRNLVDQMTDFDAVHIEEIVIDSNPILYESN